MPWWTWIALGVFPVVVLTVSTIAAVRVVRAMQAMQTTQRRTRRALRELLEAGEELEKRFAAVKERSARIERSREALRSSFAKLSLLGWALADSREAVTRLRRAVPRK